MKFIYAFLFCATLASAAAAQDVRIYYNSFLRPTVKIDSADHYIDFGVRTDTLIAYKMFTKSGVLEETGFVSSIQGLKRQQWSALFYRDGHLMDSTEFRNGLATGNKVHFFKNGRVNYRVYSQPAGIFERTMHYLYCEDQSGTVILQNGNGIFKAYDDSLRIAEEGAVVNELPTGEWTAFTSGRLIYKDKFENGKFLSGESYGEGGKVYTYTVREQLPQPPGGSERFYRMIGSRYDYSKELLQAGVRGRVVLAFVVEKDGLLTNIRVMRSLHPLADKEAVRVLMSLPNWEPGTQRGRPVRVSYMLPITLSAP